MSKSNREELIIEFLEKKGFASVNELSGALFSSPSSIRRDLARLDEKNIIKRTHGGAVLARAGKAISPFHLRMALNKDKKEAAAEKASALISNSMSVMLDGSSSAFYMLPHLKKHKDIKVFTNNIYTYQTAIEMGIEAYCLGGGASTDKEILSGIITESAAREIYADIFFFSCKSVSENGDITDPIESEIRLRKIMLGHSKTKVFLYDLSKNGRTDLFRLCNIDDVDYSFFD